MADRRVTVVMTEADRARYVAALDAAEPAGPCTDHPDWAAALSELASRLAAARVSEWGQR